MSNNKHYKALPLKNEITHVKAFMCAENDLMRKYCIVDEYIHKEQAKSSFLDCAKVTLKLYDSDTERYTKGTVDLQHAEN